MEFKSEYYNETQIESFIITFGFKDGKISDKINIKTNLTFKNYKNNKEILFMKEIKSKFISKLPKSNKLINKFITLDIETYIKDNILIPFCISIYDGKRTSSYFLSDYKNPEDLIITALNSLLVRKYNGYNIYIHNMAKFEIIFLL